MSSGSHPGSSSAGTPTRRSLWPQERLAQVFSAVGLVITLPFLVEYLFRPLRSQHFLRLAAYEEAIKPYAFLLGTVLAVCFALAFWKSKDFEHNRGKFESSSGQTKFALLLIFSPLMGFGVGWYVVASALPLVQHQLAPKTEVQIPFTITGFAYGRSCRGVRAVNSQFYDDELCGVKRSGHSTEWQGLTIVVLGRQSRYGLTMDRYRVE